MVPAPYAPWVKKAMDDFTRQELFTKSDVTETVWRAAHDTTGRLRFPDGPRGPARPCEVINQAGSDLGHVHEAGVVALEGDRDRGRRAVSVLGHDQVGLARAR
jgi:hypothetical protein